jgi:hypothetical protein
MVFIHQAERPTELETAAQARDLGSSELDTSVIK